MEIQKERLLRDILGEYEDNIIIRGLHAMCNKVIIKWEKEDQTNENETHLYNVEVLFLNKEKNIIGVLQIKNIVLFYSIVIFAVDAQNVEFVNRQEFINKIDLKKQLSVYEYRINKFGTIREANRRTAEEQEEQRRAREEQGSN